MTTGKDGIFDRAGRDYATELARTFANENKGQVVRSLEEMIEAMAEAIGFALLTMEPPRILDLQTRLHIAAQALTEAEWTEEPLTELPALAPASAPAPVPRVTYTLAASLLPGYYALDTPGGRPLVRGDRVKLRVGDRLWVHTTIEHSSTQGDGQGRYVISAFTPGNKSEGFVAITDGGVVIGLCTRMKVQLLESKKAGK